MDGDSTGTAGRQHNDHGNNRACVWVERDGSYTVKQAAKILGITEGAVKNAALGHRIASEKRAIWHIDQTRHLLFFTGAALAAYDTKRREPRKGFFRGAKGNQDLMRLRRVVALEVQR